MAEYNLSLELKPDFESGFDNSLLEKNYQMVFKPMLMFLNSHPGFYMSVAFTGPQLSYYNKIHPEALTLLHDLTVRKQVEIVGGGYYYPLFPLLFPMDRSGQIDLLSTTIRNYLGKRPYGMNIFGSIWDSSVTTSFSSCGMEYVILDSSMIYKKNLKCCPLILNDQGRTIKILPSYSFLAPKADENGEEWWERVKKYVLKYSVSGSESNHITIAMDFDEMKNFLEGNAIKYIQDNYELWQTTIQCNLVLPHTYLKSCQNYVSCYVHGGMEDKISKWSKYPYEISEKDTGNALTIHDFLSTYPQNSRLNNRMMYVSMLINQCKGGDKMRKQAASQKLWEAQCGINYVNIKTGVPAVAKKRQEAYRILTDSLKLIREAKEFHESLTSFDYNFDGINEYVAQMDNYFAVVSRKGGQILDFNMLKSSSNYASSLSRIEKYDGATDDYERGFFVDHFMAEEDLNDYVENCNIHSPIFSSILFSEKKFDYKRKELILEGKGKFSSARIPVTVRKKFNFMANGISIQYIIKNESPLELSGIFAVELNFAQTSFDRTADQFSAEIVCGTDRIECAGTNSYVKENNVSFIQIKDVACKRNFVLEPNENCGFAMSALKFFRPVDKPEAENISQSLVTKLFWKINLSAGMEMEKTISFNVVPFKIKQ